MVVEKFAVRAKCSIKPACEAVYNSAVLGFAREGLGVAILPESIADLTAYRSLRAIKTHRPAIERRIVIITRHGHSLSKAAAFLTDVLKETV